MFSLNFYATPKTLSVSKSIRKVEGSFSNGSCTMPSMQHSMKVELSGLLLSWPHSSYERTAQKIHTYNLAGQSLKQWTLALKHKPSHVIDGKGR